MTNLEKMKNSIIEQIKEMNEQQFEQFIFQLQDIAISPLDISDIKFCDICKKQYDSCPEDTSLSLCKERFVKYANEQTQ